MFIGVHDFEKLKKQNVVISIEASVPLNPNWKQDDIKGTVNYETIISAIQKIAENGHIHLIETFAEQISDHCLKMPLIHDVKICVEKPDIFSFIDSVAIEIFRTKPYSCEASSFSS